MIRPKAVPLRLDPLSYDSLRQQILRRDGWRCQSCGTMSNLEVHHREFRSHSGSDAEENLISARHTTRDSIAAEARKKSSKPKDRFASSPSISRQSLALARILSADLKQTDAMALRIHHVKAIGGVNPHARRVAEVCAFAQLHLTLLQVLAR